MHIDDATRTLIRLALSEDLGDAGDVTSLATLPPDSHTMAQFKVKAPGIIAGLPLIPEIFNLLDPAIAFSMVLNDGTPVAPGMVVATVTGETRAILAGERIALNFLQRLSGIATQTAQFVAAVAGTKAQILDTRKTTPGWRSLEKYAVRMGGGMNHRTGLYDMVLIKDNHITAAGGVTAALQAVQADTRAVGLPIEVEVKNEDELREALAYPLTRILIDNVSLDQMRSAVQITAGRVPLEASGNMTLDRVRAVAETGVDYISVGALTHSAVALDISMKLV